MAGAGQDHVKGRAVGSFDGVRIWNVFASSFRDDVQAIQTVEMSAIVGEKDKIVLQGSRADQDVEVAND